MNIIKLDKAKELAENGNILQAIHHITKERNLAFDIKEKLKKAIEHLDTLYMELNWALHFKAEPQKFILHVGKANAQVTELQNNIKPMLKELKEINVRK